MIYIVVERERERNMKKKRHLDRQVVQVIFISYKVTTSHDVCVAFVHGVRTFVRISGNQYTEYYATDSLLANVRATVRPKIESRRQARVIIQM